jgi:hypothetical protein
MFAGPSPSAAYEAVRAALGLTEVIPGPDVFLLNEWSVVHCIENMVNVYRCKGYVRRADLDAKVLAEGRPPAPVEEVEVKKKPGRKPGKRGRGRLRRRRGRGRGGRSRAVEETDEAVDGEDNQSDEDTSEDDESSE